MHVRWFSRAPPAIVDAIILIAVGAGVTWAAGIFSSQNLRLANTRALKRRLLRALECRSRQEPVLNLALDQQKRSGKPQHQARRIESVDGADGAVQGDGQCCGNALPEPGIKALAARAARFKQSRIDFPPGSRRQAVQCAGADGGANQAQGWPAHGSGHAPHLSVAALFDA